MKYLKLYDDYSKNDNLSEGLFSFLKSKSSPDKVILEYIKRLKKVKEISPYMIEKINIGFVGETHVTSTKNKYKVVFDDTPIEIYGCIAGVGREFTSEYGQDLLDDGYIKMDKSNFFKLEVLCEGEEVITLNASVKYLEELYFLCVEVYRKDIEAKKAQRIKRNINKAADLL